MFPILPHVSIAPRVRAAAVLLSATALLAIPGQRAAALVPATAATRVDAVTRATRAARATRRARARVRARAHAKLRTHAHASGRHRSRLPGLSTISAADLAVANAGGVSLRGSHAAVDRAYAEAVHDGIPFVRSNGELERRAADGEYVALSRATQDYRLKGVGSPYVRAATRDFVTRFAADYARTCNEALTVTSAMRPSSIRLRNSVEKSVHPTGMAVDLRASRSGCLGWMRTTLLGYERQGIIDATEEHHPVHFHVVVLRQP